MKNTSKMDCRKMDCTLCHTALIDKFDAYYFICTTCGAYVKDNQYYLSPMQEKKRYEEHHNDVNNIGYQKFTSPITHTVLKNFNVGHIGLDYGCGSGPVISKLLKEKGYQVILYDPYFHPNEEYLHYTYDYIFCCEVVEHFNNPKAEIEKLLRLLKAGGYLIIMTHVYDKVKEFKTWYYRNDPTHVFIYTAQTIDFVAETYGLEILERDERLIVFKKAH